MRLLNGKPLSQIKNDKDMATIEPLLDIYEAIAAIGEEMEEIREENRNLKAEIETLKGGA